MSRMLRDESIDDPVIQFGARVLYIGHEAFENTASKFWSSLIDEASMDYPGCNAISLASTGSIPLNDDLLYPVNALQRDLDSEADIDLAEAIRQAVEEINLFGPPTAVRATILSGGEKLVSRNLPLECVNDHVFSYLIVWLLQWCGIQESRWNEELLSGKINAKDRERKIDYVMKMAYRNKHLSEGLYERAVILQFSRKAAK